jgi:hypothetical protein
MGGRCLRCVNASVEFRKMPRAITTRRSLRILTGCLAVLLAVILAAIHRDAEAAGAARSAESQARRQSLTVATSALTPFFGAYYLEANLRAANAFSVLCNASYLTIENDDWKSRGATLGAGVDYYFQGDALHRWYLEAVGELAISSWRHQPSGQAAPIGLGGTSYAILGYRFVFDRGPVLDVGVGVVGVHLPGARVTTVNGPVSSEAFTRLYPAAKINLGWAF